MSSAALSSSEAVRAAKGTLHPSAASAWAMASPMPFEPPVMSAVRPARLRSNFYLPYGRGRVGRKTIWSGFGRLSNTLLQLHAGGFDQGFPAGAVLGHERPDVHEADLRRFEPWLD